MSVMETIAGPALEKVAEYVPAVRSRVKQVSDFVTSTKGKVTIVALIAIAALSYAHHMGAVSQRPKIEDLKRKLEAAELSLKQEQDKPIVETSKGISKGWLEEQARANTELQSKVKKYEQELAKRKPVRGDVVTPADARRLLDIR